MGTFAYALAVFMLLFAGFVVVLTIQEWEYIEYLWECDRELAVVSAVITGLCVVVLISGAFQIANGVLG